MAIPKAFILMIISDAGVKMTASNVMAFLKVEHSVDLGYLCYLVSTVEI